MSRNPRLSILLPVWNASATLPAALASIRRQTFTDWECLVIDDGSSDGSAEVARQLCRDDSRFVTLARPRRGLVAALNEGLELARAPLVARMDADDVMHRDRLAAEADALDRDSSLAAVGCHVRIFLRSGMSPRLREYESWLNSLESAADVQRDAFVECPVAHPTLMMRRRMTELSYCDRGWPEDYDLLLRSLEHGLRIGVVPRRLLAWRNRVDSWSRTDPAYAIERFTACKAHYLARGFLADTRTFVLWGYGDTGRLLRKALAPHGKVPSHIVEVKASRVGQRIHGARVIPISDLPALSGRRIVVSVARMGPRAEIREALDRMGFIEGRDFVCAA